MPPTRHTTALTIEEPRLMRRLVFRSARKRFQVSGCTLDDGGGLADESAAAVEFRREVDLGRRMTCWAHRGALQRAVKRNGCFGVAVENRHCCLAEVLIAADRHFDGEAGRTDRLANWASLMGTALANMANSTASEARGKYDMRCLHSFEILATS